MTTSVMIGIVAFFLAIVVNRSIMARAMRRLDDQTKLKLIDVFSRRNTWSTVFLLGIILVYFAAIRFYPGWGLKFTIGSLAAFLAYMAVKIFINHRKLKEIGAPAFYINSFFAGYGVFITGLIVMAVCLYWDGVV